jgi:PncC family amidohydrolase
MFSEKALIKSKALLKGLKKHNLRLSVAESCTGGLFSALITETPGSSEVFDRGFVTYSNKSKVDLLTVPTFYLNDYGAVSRETVIAMAEGALLMSSANISIAITGIAGPKGGNENHQIGTVFISCAQKGKNTIYKKYHFSGNRQEIREQSIDSAMDLLINNIKTIEVEKVTVNSDNLAFA